MTADLAEMTQLRDMQVAMEVAQKFELGWFDVEFTLYGCAYMKNDKRYYRISDNAEKIYDFIEYALLQKIYPTNIVEMTKKCPVPAGMQEYIAQDIKRELAKELQQSYPYEFFIFLSDFINNVSDNSAESIIKIEKEKAFGYFDEEKLESFSQLLNFAYKNGKLSTAMYEKYCKEIEDERKDMIDNPVKKDIIEKTFFGLSYEKNTELQYYYNACKANVYKKKYSLEYEGIFTTPIFEKKYWLNYTQKILDIQQMFRKELQQKINRPIYTLYKSLNYNKKINREEFGDIANIVKMKYGEKPYVSFIRYGYRLGIL